MFSSPTNQIRRIPILGKFALSLPILLGLSVVTALTERAQADIVPPGATIAGRTQLSWAEAWWQWALSIPAPNNPLLDQSGANAGVNNQGPVFFVAGVFGSGTVMRTFDAPSGKTLFFPVVNGFYAPIGAGGKYDPSPCLAPLSFQCALQQATGAFTPLYDMSVQIDGVTLNLDQLQRYRQTSSSYFGGVNLPDNNIFGLPVLGFTRTSVWVQDGYYVALTNLSLGRHSLVFQAKWSSGKLSVTDTINIVPPQEYAGQHAPK